MHLFRTLICFFVSAGFLGLLLLSAVGPMAPATLRASIRAQHSTILPATPTTAQPVMQAVKQVTAYRAEVRPTSI
ncbi:hypothetical protein J0X19_23325 [Hymenobacter sp. BT186]|uniref:Uncharacterized protein n=1 Tax=Hymenobacter telluris TaxID=2816474 RepID=A0A939JD59_9BACT|nr:hypothetical protein [Hymenobacter telluris]MBO0360911.1 hypothetical protein [Hymenobacter telluris]MBW3376940.1 hypothetical protein [Hymenobacter norwichensis]